MHVLTVINDGIPFYLVQFISVNTVAFKFNLPQSNCNLSHMLPFNNGDNYFVSLFFEVWAKEFIGISRL